VHLVWLLTMVTIPFTTQLLTNTDYYQQGATALYVAVLLVSSVSLHLLGLHGRRHRELLQDRPEVTEWLDGPNTWTAVIVLTVILVVVAVFPALGAWPLLLLFVEGSVENWFVQRRRVASR
jgi:uncharacterized membrane protein